MVARNSRTTTMFSARSKGRAQMPGGEFFVADSGQLAFGFLAAGDSEDLFKNALAHLLHGLGAVEDGAGVDVHVLVHVREQGRMSGDFDAGRGLAAVNAPAA